MTTMTDQKPAPTPAQILDRIAASVLLGLEAMLGLAALGMSCMFAMATDSCGTGTDCQTGYVMAGMLLAWAGIAVGFGGSLAMVGLDWSRGRTVWFWPLLGAAVIAVTLIAGGALASQAM